jgi:predicted Rossmann fold flavoprotein
MSVEAPIIVIGAGAAGCFAAIHAAAGGHPVTVLEGGREPLTKVRISGGGRCNVTHACFEPEALAAYYPRGGRELRGAFHRWQPRDTVAWFEARGIRLKTEADGRMFPVTDTSATIVDGLLGAMKDAGVVLACNQRVVDIRPRTEGGWTLFMKDGGVRDAARVMLAVGGLRQSGLIPVLQRLGHRITPLAPSLFTFNIADIRLKGLAGVSVPSAVVRLEQLKLEQTGPVLITHWGLSGPGILKLSSKAARDLAEVDYRFTVRVSWLGEQSRAQVETALDALKQDNPKRKVVNTPLAPLPQRLWQRLVEAVGVAPDQVWAHLGKTERQRLAEELADGRYPVSGKSTNKDEFVTCGGVVLKEVDWRTMESRVVPGLHFGGECLDLDGLTGGFNFQAAWTTGYLAGQAMAG